MAQKTDDLTVFLALSWSVLVKAACKILAKLTTDSISPTFNEQS